MQMYVRYLEPLAIELILDLINFIFRQFSDVNDIQPLGQHGTDCVEQFYTQLQRTHVPVFKFLAYL